MVFVGARLDNVDAKVKACVKDLDENIRGKQVANVMFKDDSFITIVGQVLVVYLNPIIPRQLLYFFLFFLVVTGYFTHLYLLYYIAGAMFALFTLFKFIVFFMLTQALRKQGYTGTITRI